jgi:multiple sugar transport system permease protein
MSETKQNNVKPGLARGAARGLSDRTVRNLCIFPVLILLIAFNVFPLFASLGLSFTNYTQAKNVKAEGAAGGDAKPGEKQPEPTKYVGLENYSNLVNGPKTQTEVWPAFTRSAGLVVLTVGLQTVLGYGAALMLHRKFFGRGAILALLLIPMMLSPAVVASFWKYMFKPDWGIVNYLMGVRWNWDGKEQLAFWAVVIVEVWMWTPFMMLLSIAGLNSIPQSLYEAADVDRASAWFRFKSITLPLSAPLVMLGIVFRMMDTFRLFDTAAVLNDEVETYSSTTVSVLLHATGFKITSGNLGQSTAMAYLLLIVAIALGNIAVRYLDKLRNRGDA